MASTSATPSQIKVRALAERELADADRVFRLAFGTFVRAPDPSRFGGDADYVRSRWIADPSAALGAFEGERLIGSNFVENWGSFGYFGPLTVDPAYWDKKIAQQLLEPTMEIFRRWSNTHLGLFTFAHSPKHMALYQKFGFWPRDLVALMGREVAGWQGGVHLETARFSESAQGNRQRFLADCRGVAERNFSGLDLSHQIESVDRQKLGDTLLVYRGSQAAGFAVCHTGAGSEAGSGTCYIKFAAVRPDVYAEETLGALLAAVRDFAVSREAAKVTAGVNLARRETFRCMLRDGFRTAMQGVAMETGDPFAGYNHAGVYILDDWR
jgi:GNAT superfamily N-acetyltransferase